MKEEFYLIWYTDSEGWIIENFYNEIEAIRRSQELCCKRFTKKPIKIFEKIHEIRPTN